MRRFLIFAGTTEGRELAELLCGCGCELTVCVATEYGREVLPQCKDLTVLVGRRDTCEMTRLMTKNKFDCVFDATHPYAAEVSANCREACLTAKTEYLRVLRRKAKTEDAFTSVKSAAEAAEYLAKMGYSALVTTGSKELDCFTVVPQYEKKLFVRVLPDEASLGHCLRLGFERKNIICMQGPFSAELNAAMLKQTGAACLVTKASGSAGGFYQKCEAARLAGAKLVVIGCPPDENGVYTDEIPRFLSASFGILPKTPKLAQQSPNEPKALYFPLFVNLTDKKAVVFGGGTVAARRAAVLKKFGCRLTVVAPYICEELKAQGGSKLLLCNRGYRQGDCVDAELVVAATDSREVNHSIYEECKELDCYVSVADCKDESTFYFPGIAQKGCVVAGVTASGQNHAAAAAFTKKLDELLQKEGETGFE
ncbi:MAG: precorrin-6A reductase [Hydrogenoanaerobacterium sp.]